MSFRYRLCGVTLESELEVPELPVATGEADVWLTTGPVPEHLSRPVSEGVYFEAGLDGYLLRVPATARYLVRDGRQIIVDVAEGASPRDVRTLLLGPVITAVLHQRGALVIHAGAVVGARGAVIIAGDSGHGKSTLLAALAERGYPVLADDTTAITLDDAQALRVHPAFPSMRLWRDALTRMGRATDDLTRSMDHVEKYQVALATRFHTVPVPPVAMFVLRVANEPGVRCEVVSDSESFAEVRAQTRSLRALEGLELLAGHFQLAARMTQQVTVHRLTRPRDVDTVAELAGIVEPFLR